LNAFTSHDNYYLYTWDDGNPVVLSSIDGSIETYINLDTLEFSREGYDFSVLQDTLTFEKTASNTIKIYYRNLQGDNTALNLTIERMDTDEVIFSSTSFLDLNEFTIYVDTSTVSNKTNSTLYRATIYKTTAEGTETFKRYFNENASVGMIASGVAFTIAFLLLIFGLSMAVARLTFSWLGIFVCLASLAVLALSIAAWYITLMMAINLIVLVYIVMMMMNQNYATVS